MSTEKEIKRPYGTGSKITSNIIMDKSLNDILKAYACSKGWTKDQAIQHIISKFFKTNYTRKNSNNS